MNDIHYQNDLYYFSLPINSIKVCIDALIDYYDLPPDTQEKLDNLCCAMNDAIIAYRASVDKNDLRNIEYWGKEIPVIQEAINDLLFDNSIFSCFI